MDDLQNLIDKLQVYQFLVAPIETPLENHIAWIEVTRMIPYGSVTPEYAYAIDTIEVEYQLYQAWLDGADITPATEATNHKRQYAVDEHELETIVSEFIKDLSVLKTRKYAKEMGYKFI